MAVPSPPSPCVHLLPRRDCWMCLPAGIPGHRSISVCLLLSARGPPGSPLWPQVAGFPSALGLDVSGRHGETDPRHQNATGGVPGRPQGWGKGHPLQGAEALATCVPLGGVSWGITRGPQEQQGSLKKPEGRGSGNESWASWGHCVSWRHGVRPGKQVCGGWNVAPGSGHSRSHWVMG